MARHIKCGWLRVDEAIREGKGKGRVGLRPEVSTVYRPRGISPVWNGHDECGTTHDKKIPSLKRASKRAPRRVGLQIDARQTSACENDGIKCRLLKAYHVMLDNQPNSGKLKEKEEVDFTTIGRPLIQFSKVACRSHGAK